MTITSVNSLQHFYQLTDNDDQVSLVDFFATWSVPEPFFRSARGHST